MNSPKLKKTVLILLIILLTSIDIYLFWRHTKTSIFCSRNTIMNIVAHEDDDLLFLSPDLIHNINDDKCVRTIFITAGDAGSDSSYWLNRENGSKTAYASMLNTENNWIENQIIIGNNKISVLNLKNYPKISLIFLRLPDGNFKGTGYVNHNYQSIAKLWQNKLASINTVDNSNIYTKRSLVSVLLNLMKIYNPVEIHTQDFIGNFIDGDHSDHYAASYFTREAEKIYGKPHVIISYMGYAIGSRTKNVFGKDAIKKQSVFLLYSKYDKYLNLDYIPWLTRQYTIFTKKMN